MFTYLFESCIMDKEDQIVNIDLIATVLFTKKEIIFLCFFICRIRYSYQ